MANRFHPNEDIDQLFENLQNALCSWERTTGRESLLIYRESDRNLAQNGPQPSAVCLRWHNGVSVDPANADLDDSHLLERFTDALRDRAVPAGELGELQAYRILDAAGRIDRS